MKKVYYNHLLTRKKPNILKEIFGIVSISVNKASVGKYRYTLIGFIQKKMNFVQDINPNLIPKNIFQKMSTSFFINQSLLVLKKKRHSLFIIVCEKAYNIQNLQMLSTYFDADIKIFISTHQNIINCIENIIDHKNYKLKKIKEISGMLYDLDTKKKNISQTVKIVNFVISKAIRKRASDIHIEPRENSSLIRFRIDGQLQILSKIPKNQHLLISSRIKIMSGLNIAETRLPQDGRTSIFINKERRDVRVSTVPSLNGERIVLRVLKSSSTLKNINQLGLSNESLNALIYVLNSTNGLMLVTGPTGSGKTTTLYAALSYINKYNINIMTIEDPIEYNLMGINQTQVQKKIKLDFASGLRSFLRQDPDVLMVGEIRDQETAQIAINAALTGHLVLSTIHTNDSFGTLTRLINMNIEPFLITSAILAIITQRLVRVICIYCKYSYRPFVNEVKWLSIRSVSNLKNKVFWKGKGCFRCYNTGYFGRVGIFELALINKSIYLDIKKNNIKKCIRFINNQTLLSDGLNKIFSGITTISEINKVLKIE